MITPLHHPDDKPGGHNAESTIDDILDDYKGRVAGLITFDDGPTGTWAGDIALLRGFIKEAVTWHEAQASLGGTIGAIARHLGIPTEPIEGEALPYQTWAELQALIIRAVVDLVSSPEQIAKAGEPLTDPNMVVIIVNARERCVDQCSELGVVELATLAGMDPSSSLRVTFKYSDLAEVVGPREGELHKGHFLFPCDDLRINVTGSTPVHELNDDKRLALEVWLQPIYDSMGLPRTMSDEAFEAALPIAGPILKKYKMAHRPKKK